MPGWPRPDALPACCDTLARLQHRLASPCDADGTGGIPLSALGLWVGLFQWAIAPTLQQTQNAQAVIDMLLQASGCFQQAGHNYLAGYSALLANQPPLAKTCWQPLIYARENHWANALWGFTQGELTSLPTPVQIRQHLEADVMTLARFQQWDMLRHLLSFGHLFNSINAESFKLIGRAFLHLSQANVPGRAQWVNEAYSWLNAGIKELPTDPEAYYHLAQWHVAQGQPEEAALMLKQCLLMSPHYPPAARLLDSL